MIDTPTFDSFLRQVLASSLSEQIAVAAGIGYALLVIRRSRWAWACGGVSSAILAVLAAGAALPLQAVLQGAYVLMAVYGFWHWTRESGEPVAITVWPWRRHVAALLVTIVVAFAAAPWLAANGAAWPMLDAGVTVVSLLATWMVARAVLVQHGIERLAIAGLRAPAGRGQPGLLAEVVLVQVDTQVIGLARHAQPGDRKSTRLNSSHRT